MHGTLRVIIWTERNYLLIQFITYLPCCGYVKYLIKGGKFAQFSYLRIFKVIGEMRGFTGMPFLSGHVILTS